LTPVQRSLNCAGRTTGDGCDGSLRRSYGGWHTLQEPSSEGWPTLSPTRRRFDAEDNGPPTVRNPRPLYDRRTSTTRYSAQAHTGGHVTPSRVDEAASLCQELLTDGWQEMVAGRAAEYLTEATWQKLTRGGQPRHCRALARLARRILRGKQRLHDVVGSVARKSVLLLGGRRFAQALAAELAAKLPLPFDEQAIAVARGIQVSGVLLCLAEGRNLTRCACFIDLAREEGNAHFSPHGPGSRPSICCTGSSASAVIAWPTIIGAAPVSTPAPSRPVRSRPADPSSDPEQHVVLAQQRAEIDQLPDCLPPGQHDVLALASTACPQRSRR
jgi:hypothetical protein